ncbi:steroid dehydrogenase, putative [Plasmodium sp. gorilla clade G2]|uniref:steroid dehydrogenase, putative n=1 Tax=Plasmodium sp. gorilla clade G2 TaxID=880535 RepID=UPI000D20E51E|nr:steroid dehydrogenase, putative [Plasmodium sp. gorilla clade G2]SOV11509.1 steroid dehydrogenase, putative [Plasmodium sp. gorilla clade G2]
MIISLNSFSSGLTRPIFLVGLFVFLKNILYFFFWLFNYVKCKIALKNLKSYGDTVIITGCTDGIGKSLTYSLIKQNVNLLLISRNETELMNMKRDLLEKNKNYKGTIEYITFDYNANDFTKYKIIDDKIRSMDIGILINNVGVSYPHPLYFHEMEPELIEQLVNVNLLSSYYMTKLVLPNMIKKKKGLVLYTSSGITALKSCPLYTIYGSVKDAICSFANSLSVELKEYNIQVQCHVPLFIVTKLSKIKNPGLFVPTSDIYAKSAIQKMREGNVLSYKVICSPYLFHKLQIFIYNCFPKIIFDSITLALLKILRLKALKKLKKRE